MKYRTVEILIIFTAALAAAFSAYSSFLANRISHASNTAQDKLLELQMEANREIEKANSLYSRIEMSRNKPVYEIDYDAIESSIYINPVRNIRNISVMANYNYLLLIMIKHEKMTNTHTSHPVKLNYYSEGILVVPDYKYYHRMIREKSNILLNDIHDGVLIKQAIKNHLESFEEIHGFVAYPLVSIDISYIDIYDKKHTDSWIIFHEKLFEGRENTINEINSLHFPHSKIELSHAMMLSNHLYGTPDMQSSLPRLNAYNNQWDASHKVFNYENIATSQVKNYIDSLLSELKKETTNLQSTGSVHFNIRQQHVIEW